LQAIALGKVEALQDDQELLRGAFGFASRTWNIPATVETRFDTASITCRRCR
jgi:CubicO group peptidase (beta-lactamase class C family)